MALPTSSRLLIRAAKNNHLSTTLLSKLSNKRALHIGGKSALMGISAFKSAADFPLLSAGVIKNCIALRDEISIETDPLRTLLLLDQISNEVCSVIDVAEFCRIAHDDEEYRVQAEEAFSTLSTFIHSLNTDITLYSTLQRIVDTDSILSLLPEEHQIFAKDLKSEFESGGIHLRGKDKEVAVALQGDVVTSETKFVQETFRVDEKSNFIIGPFDSEQDYRRFSSWLGQYVVQSNQLPKSHVMCSASRRVSATVLKSLDQEPLRETVWMNMMSEPSKNVITLGQMIKDRQALAKSLGYKSFAHKYLANKVLKTPEEVQTFLSDIAVTVRPKARKQLDTLLSLKRSLLKGNENKGNKDVLSPWDISYLTSIAESSGEQGKRKDAISAVSEYFPLNSCVEGLVGITEALFGVKVTVSDVPLGETWLRTEDAPHSTSSDSNQSVKFGYLLGALKCQFSDARGESLGTVYLDLFHRPVKFPGAAHFSLICGCSNTSHNSINAQSSSSSSGSSSSSRHTTAHNTGHEYQLPVVALSFNFSPPASFSGKVPSLSLSDVETLHHEWGHALHSLLSRTTFQHLSGTRGATDFMEVPSHLFEYFARTPSVVSQWARHNSTGLPIPSGMLEEALENRKSFAAIEFQSQILYSAADQFLFGPDIGDVSGMTPTETYQHALVGVAAMQEELTDLPVGRLMSRSGANREGRGVRCPSMSMLCHTHFVNYGGGYYSYIFAKLHSAQIWSHVFEKNPLSRDGGLLLWQRMLQFGAARNTKEMLSELSGGSLKADHYMNAL